MTSILSKTYAVRGKQAVPHRAVDMCHICSLFSILTPHFVAFCNSHTWSLLSRSHTEASLSFLTQERWAKHVCSTACDPFCISMGFFCSKELLKGLWIVLGRFHEDASGQTQHSYGATVTCVTLTGRSRGKTTLEKFENWAGLTGRFGRSSRGTVASKQARPATKKKHIMECVQSLSCMSPWTSWPLLLCWSRLPH